MATVEERLAAIEHQQAGLKHDNTELKHNNDEIKQKIELHTIAIGAMVNKATLDSINEKNDKIFKALMAHDEFTNAQLAELREKVEVDLDGKIVGMQTEVRQRFDEQDGKIVGMQTEMRQGFEAVNARFERQDAKLQQLIDLLTGQSPQL